MGGKHELSFGAEYMKRFLNVGQPPASSGAYNFDISATDQTTTRWVQTVGGSDFASFLLGMGGPGYESLNFTQDLFSAEASPYYAAFIQDTYHASQNLTITAGLRWDIFGGKTERHNRLEYFDPTAVGTYPASGLPFTGGEVFVSSGHRSPFTTKHEELWSTPGPGMEANEAPGCSRRRRLLLWAERTDGQQCHENSDGYSTNNNWNATCYNEILTPPTWAIRCSTAPTNVRCGTGKSAPSVTGTYSLSNPFPTGLVPPSQLHPSGLQTNLGANLNTMLHSQRTPETYNFNFGLEYEFPTRSFSAPATWAAGASSFRCRVDLNQLTLSQIEQIGAAANTPLNLWRRSLSRNLPPAASTAGVAVHGYPGGDSEYSSLQTKVQKRMTNHFTTLASFTWAKLMTDDGHPPLDFIGFHSGAPRTGGKWLRAFRQPAGREVSIHMAGILRPARGQGQGDESERSIECHPGRLDGQRDFLPEHRRSHRCAVCRENIYLNQRADMICDPRRARRIRQQVVQTQLLRGLGPKWRRGQPVYSWNRASVS